MTVQQAIDKNVWLYNDYSGSYYWFNSLIGGVLDYYIYMPWTFYHVVGGGIKGNEHINRIIESRPKISQEDPPQKDVIRALFTRFEQERL
jgi:hypothetical protein